MDIALRRAFWAGLLILPVIAIGSGIWSRRDRAADSGWPQTARHIVDPESGNGYWLEQVFGPAGRERIAATLIRPDDERSRSLLIAVSGSGDGLEPAEGALQRRLVRHGYAVLRLGKKGVGASSGNWRNENFEERARNVRAALDWAAARPDLDAHRIVLYGHSQGGYVIPLVADDPRVAALILAAGSARSVRDQIADEWYETARRTGADEAQARRRAARNQRWLDIALAGCPVLRYHYLCHVYDYDPATALASVRKPVLALFAENDVMVPPSTNLARMRTLLAENAAVRFAVLPRSNHMFWTSVSGLPDEYAELLGPVAAFPHAQPGNADHERLGGQWVNRAPYAKGYFEEIDAFLGRHVPQVEA